MSNGLADIFQRIDAIQGVAQTLVNQKVIRKLYRLRCYIRRNRMRIVRKFSRLVQYTIKVER